MTNGFDPTRRAGDPEHPRSEPEILPPDGVRGSGARSGGARASGPHAGGPYAGSAGRAGAHDPNVFVYMDANGQTHRVNVKTPGPFSIILVLLAVGLIAAVVLALVLGALVFLIPIAAMALAALVAYFYARGLWQRWRGGPQG